MPRRRWESTRFVVDWYGDRDAFNARTYELLQPIAAEENFHIAMMYDETDHADGATDEASRTSRCSATTIWLRTRRDTQAYLTDNGRPMIFIFPKGGHTDWNRVHEEVSKWNPAPLLIYENLPGPDAADFDGFYAWVQPGSKGYAPDGSNWGKDYLAQFYSTMVTKYPGKIAVGGAWAQFDDSKASWGLNRHISAAAGRPSRIRLTSGASIYPPNQPLPYLLIETWNDYEEGTAVERGIPTCKTKRNRPSDGRAL